MKKCKHSNQSWHLALLEYLCTLISDMIPSPIALCGCAFKGLLPSFLRNNNNNLSFSDSLQDRCDKEKSHFDVNSKDLPIIPVGSAVMVYDHQTKCWKLGKVDSRDSDNNCPYFVKFENGMMVSRNSINLRPKFLSFVEQSTQNHSNTNKTNTELNPVCKVPGKTISASSTKVPNGSDKCKSDSDPNVPYHTKSGRVVVKPN